MASHAGLRRHYPRCFQIDIHCGQDSIWHATVRWQNTGEIVGQAHARTQFDCEAAISKMLDDQRRFSTESIPPNMRLMSEEIPF